MFVIMAMDASVNTGLAEIEIAIIADTTMKVLIRIENRVRAVAAVISLSA